jgi:hypothetical protein
VNILYFRGFSFYKDFEGAPPSEQYLTNRFVQKKKKLLRTAAPLISVMILLPDIF